MESENQQNEVGELEGVKKRSIWKIDKRMLPYKAHYFLFIGAMGVIVPYYPSIGISRLGLGAGNLAAVFTVQQFLFVFLKPLICYTADYFNNLKEMIMTLTVIAVMSSYLLLAIPKVRDDNFIDINNESLEINLLDHTVFCKLCPVSSELKTVADYIPVTKDEYLDEVFCAQENTVFESFTVSCPNNSNFIDALVIKLEIKISTCYAPKNKSIESRNIDVKSLNKNSSTMFIKWYHNSISPELDIICPVIKHLFIFNTSNFTINDFIKFCFKHPQYEITSNATEDKYQSPSKYIVCNNSELSKRIQIIKNNSFKTYQFWLYTLFLLISTACNSGIIILSDTACHETVQKNGAEYGKQRAWGAISWGLVAPFGGFLNDYTDDYWASMIVMSLLCALQIWNLSKISLEKPQYSQSILKDIKNILSSCEFIAFEIGVFLNGIGFGIVWYFLTWFITDIGGSRLLIGLAHTVQCFLGEMPLMLLSGWLIRKIGHFNVVSMALFAYSVRFLSYSSLNDPWLILPIECLDGITFGAFYATMTSYAKMNAKPGTEATTQSILSSFYGFGSAIGCVIGGPCFDYFGGYTTFFYVGLCFAGAAAINVTSTVLIHFRKRTSEIYKAVPLAVFAAE